MAIELSDDATGCKLLGNVWAVFAFGFHKGKVAALSRQSRYDSKEDAEEATAGWWCRSYPDAVQMPSVMVLGPYLLEKDTS